MAGSTVETERASVAGRGSRELEGRVAIVTGGARGIGRAYCLGLAERGASVLVADLADGSEVADEVRATGGEAETVRVDVSDRASTEEMAKAAISRFGRIDVLVNNAGYGYRAAVEEADEADIRTLFDTNFFGLVAMTQAVLPGMRARRQGTIVNMSSRSGTGEPHSIGGVRSSATERVVTAHRRSVPTSES